MPFPPLGMIVALGKYLFQPFHNSRKFHPLRRLDIKLKPILSKTQSPNLENEAHAGLLEDLCKQAPCPRGTEEGFPIVDTGMDFVPDSLFERT
jgi:hypothetical protein